MSAVLDWAGVVGGALGGLAALYTGLRYRAIEDYRARLKAEGFEHEVRFGRLHERRVEVIADLYSKLVEAEGAFGNWVSPLQGGGEPAMPEKGKAAVTAGNALRMAFLTSRIWLDEDICEQIAKVDKHLFETTIWFTTYDPDDPNTRREYLEEWQKAWRRIRDDIPPLRQTIETRFREMLGVVGPP